MKAEVAIFGVEVISLTGSSEGGRALALGKGRILAAGSEQDINALLDPTTKVLDLSGRAVLPGFIDTHVHLTQIGLGQAGPSLSGVTSVREVLKRIGRALEGRAKDEPVLIHGCWLNGLDGPLERAELDRAAPQNPLMILDPGGHGCLVNTPGLRFVDLPDRVPGLSQPSAHSFQGALVGPANALARQRFYERAVSDGERVQALHRAAEAALRKGVTTIHALEGGAPDGRSCFPRRDIEVLLREQARLPLDTVIYYQSTEVDQARAWGLDRIGGCLLADGSYGEHTTALKEPYFDDSETRGSLYFSDQELDEFVGRAHRAGLQISLHAIGDRAIGQVLAAFERALERDPRPDHRHRIEHFSLPTREQIEKAARLGVAAAMQPNFAALPPDHQPGAFRVAGYKQLGPERTARRHPYRLIADSGVLVAGGSGTRPPDPLEGIKAVAAHPEEERRLTIREALELYTVNAARIGFQEREKGTIEPGKAADLVVLNRNPLTLDPAQLDSLRVELTIAGGKVFAPEEKQAPPR